MSLSVLIVGCGNIAGGYDRDDQPLIRTHAKAYRQHGGFTLAACVDPDMGKAEAFAETWGVATCYRDIGDIADRRFDVVSLCSPTEHHAAQLRQLLGWPVRLVYGEKPVTPDLAVTRGIVADYERAGLPLAVNYLRRWEACVRQVQSEDWGRLLVAHGVYTKGLLTNGSHLIDLASALLGPLRADAVTGIMDDHEPHDPTIAAILRTGQGAPVILSAGDRRCFTIFELDLLFEKGRVTFGDSGYRWCRRPVGDDPRYQGYRSLEAADWQPTALGEAMAAAVANIYDHLRAGAPLLSTGKTALATQELCAELQRRAKTV